MNKYSLKNDYSEGVHPNILKALSCDNLNQTDCYGLDVYCNKAAKLIKEQIDCPHAEVHFVTTGTQANLVLLSSVLRPYESVIAAETGHIAVHETGAIEATGHKINTIETLDGKLTMQHIDQVLNFHSDEHMVKPKLVYLSNSTELGTIYSKNELKALSTYCKKNDLYLFLDGARLASALTAEDNDLSLADLPKYVDAFYIGGTKNGAMFGEALVLIHPNFTKDFRFILKQRGALVSKSRFLGIQFVELFSNQLFFENAKRANKLAKRLSQGIKKAGYNFLIQPVTNMIFPILPNELIEKLTPQFDFYVIKKIDEKQSAIRLVTSWATQEKQIDAFLKNL